MIAVRAPRFSKWESKSYLTTLNLKEEATEIRQFAAEL